jgi:glycosyltransferase involved in cell wall biosynthesis
LLYLGRLKKYKSVQHLILAFGRLQKRLPQARLQIVGDGDYRGALERQVARLRLSDRVQFLGFIGAQEKVRRLQQAWVAVCPSLKEGWGLTNIEANACGTAVVGADVPGLRDSVQEGTNGYLYPYGDVSALEDRLFRLLTEGAERARLEQGALAWSQRFDWDQAAAQLGTLIDSEIDRRRRR